MSEAKKNNDFLKTGIKGLDDIFTDKGLKKKSTVLVTGSPGTGKSILVWQYIYNGAKLYNEPGLLVTIEESAEEVRENALELGMDFAPLEKKGLVTILEKPLMSKSIFGAGELSEQIRKKKVKRVGMDSLTLFEYIYPQESVEYRNELLRFLKQMDVEGITLMCVAERKSTDLDNFHYLSQDFLFSGLILLTKIRKGASFERVLHVAKMRGQDHSLGIVPITIKNGGVEAYPNETPFALVEQDIRKKK